MTMNRFRTAACSLAFFSLLGGCRMSLSPLKNRIGIGVESYVVFDAPGESDEGDLFAVNAEGGQVFRITFSRAHEAAPALSPDGVMLAFIRGRTAVDTSGHRVWVMNLLNGAERKIELPEGAGAPVAVAWSGDGTRLFIRAGRDYAASAPPKDPDVQPASPAGDSAFRVLLGEPPVGEVVACPDGAGICARLGDGTVQVLTDRGRNALAWGSDSVAYLVGDQLEVRPLAGGNVRRPQWNGAPSGIRSVTWFRGNPDLEERENPSYRSPLKRPGT